MVVVLIIGVLVADRDPRLRHSARHAEKRTCFANQRAIEGVIIVWKVDPDRHRPVAAGRRRQRLQPARRRTASSGRPLPGRADAGESATTRRSPRARTPLDDSGQRRSRAPSAASGLTAASTSADIAAASPRRLLGDTALCSVVARTCGSAATYPMPGGFMQHGVFEDVRIEGHLIDSGIVSQVMDHIIAFGGEFEMLSFEVGRTNTDVSVAVLRVRASDQATSRRDPERHPVARRVLRRRLRRDDGARAAGRRLPRQLLLDHQHGDRRSHRRRMGARRQSRDGPRRACRRRSRGVAEAIPMADVRAGDLYVVGHERHPRAPAGAPARQAGVRVHVERGLLGEAEGAGRGRRREDAARHARGGQGRHRGRRAGGRAHRARRATSRGS